MTSLKVRHANEIAEAMAKMLDDDKFMEVYQPIQKEAAEKEESVKENVESKVEASEEEKLEVQAEEIDKKTQAALDFTIGNLAKVADALDANGFAGLADIVDETIGKIAEKKS